MPPLAVPSSFVRTSPVSPTASWNILACCEAVLAGGRVEHHQRLVGRAGHWRADDALELGQLVHQVATSCAAGRRCPRCSTSTPRAMRRLHGVEDHRDGIGARRPGGSTSTSMRRPHVLELLDGGGAEGVARRASMTRLPVGLEGRGELAACWSSCREPLTPSMRITVGCASRSSGAGAAESVSSRKRAQERAGRPGSDGPAPLDLVAALACTKAPAAARRRDRQRSAPPPAPRAAPRPRAARRRARRRAHRRGGRGSAAGPDGPDR